MKKPAFTLFELLVVCTLLCLLATWLLRTPRRLHDQFLRVAATNLHLALRNAAEKARSENAAHTIKLPTLPPQVQFGAPHRALGPPSKQHTPITSPITVAHTHDSFGYHVAVTAAGTLPPGTFYITNEIRDDGYALSSTGNYSSPLRCYRWLRGCWRLC
ncbi:MAG: hypothetical protein PVJ92_00045 [Candidatus Dependentiae bacterium]|jgi:hypothetical protein